MTGYYDRKNPERTPRPKHPNGRTPPNPLAISPHLSAVRARKAQQRAVKFDKKVDRKYRKQQKSGGSFGLFKFLLLIFPILLGLWAFADVLFK